jgi:hypothetical protein
VDVHGYLDEIEQNVDNPTALERLRGQALETPALSDDEKRAISERVATYLADADRAEFGNEHGPDNAPEEQ